jgi:hypothetical protein
LYGFEFIASASGSKAMPLSIPYRIGVTPAKVVASICQGELRIELMKLYLIKKYLTNYYFVVTARYLLTQLV